MLTKLNIKNFKCFLDSEMTLSRLNLFVGANSSGKSSAIQALRLCLGNAGKPQGKEFQMTIKDKKTGQFNELNSFLTNEKSFIIGIDTTDGELRTTYTFGDDTRVSTLMTMESIPTELAHSLAGKSVFYLPANRDSAKDAFPMNMEADSEIGEGGEYVIDYYAHHSGDKLDDTLIVDGNLKTLEGQVNHWLRLLTGYTLKVIPQGEAYAVKYKNVMGREIRPYHVGTGVSFIAALLIACLSMPQDGLVIIENPEIHLHPRAQAVVLDFFAMVSHTGRQLLIETHSDHLFNGVRRLLAQRQLTPTEVSVCFFKTRENLESTPVRINLTETGRMTQYEKGLFDQFDDDLDVILQAK